LVWFGPVRLCFKAIVPVLALPLLLTGVGCEDEAPPAPAPPAIEVSPLSLVVSRRADGVVPEGALEIVIAPNGVTAQGRPVLDLESGRMAVVAWNGRHIREVTAALDVAGSPQAVVLKTQASVPYITVSRILATVAAHGVRSVFFAVRPGSSAEVGYLPIDLAGTRLTSYEPVAFEGPAQREWQEFVDLWSEIETSCQGEGMVDCNRKLDSIAEGGLVEIELFARQDAMRVLFRRHGVEGDTVEEPPPFMPPQNTRQRRAPGEPEAAPPPEPPARSANFMWRRRAATADPSPISLAMRPLCGARPCAVRVSGDNLTPISSVLQLIGVAFPDGAPAPVVLWEYPED
jgi:hypothetical protein